MKRIASIALIIAIAMTLVPSTTLAADTYEDWNSGAKTGAMWAYYGVGAGMPIIIGIVSIIQASNQDPFSGAVFSEKRFPVEVWTNSNLDQRVQFGFRFVDTAHGTANVYLGIGPNKANETSGWYGATAGHVFRQNHLLLLNHIEVGCAAGDKTAKDRTITNWSDLEMRYEITTGHLRQAGDPWWMPNVRIGWSFERSEPIAAFSCSFF